MYLQLNDSAGTSAVLGDGQMLVKNHRAGLARLPELPHGAATSKRPAAPPLPSAGRLSYVTAFPATRRKTRQLFSKLSTDSDWTPIQIEFE
jgi:hypothetical protein